MKFGNVDEPDKINFGVPGDKSHLTSERPDTFNSFVGLGRWNKEDIRGFYPGGTENELAYYSGQFNSIELNATFFKMFPAEQFDKWREMSAPGFVFFPKIPQDISHVRRLRDVEPLVDEFVNNISHLREKLGVVFLQMHNNFGPSFQNPLSAEKLGLGGD